MSLVKFYVVLSVLMLMCSVSGLNILGIFPYHGKSHFMVFKVYLKELANRGHNVTVVSHFPQTDAPKNYQDIALLNNIYKGAGIMPLERSYIDILKNGIYLTFSGAQDCEDLLKNAAVQKLIKQNPKFDIIVFEYFISDCALGIAHHLKAPVISLNTNLMFPWHYRRLGISSNPSFVPCRFLDGGSMPGLRQRFEALIFNFYFTTLYDIVTLRSNQNTLAKYFDNTPPLEDLARDIKFILSYNNFILTGTRLLPSNVIEVGGYHVPAAKPLAGDLHRFIEGAKNGIIYISFGTVIKESSLAADKLQAILEAIEELPYRFIWKFKDAANLVAKVGKEKLLVSDWLPQIDILAHPKTLAFFSHSGMLSTTETIHFGVPMVAMPIFGDQPANAAFVEEKGLGVRILIRDLNKENLVNAFKKVLKPGFREKVKLLSKAWHDRPLSPLDTAIYWTEFAARHANFSFKPAAAEVPFYQYMYLDIALVFIVLTSIIVFVLKYLCSLCCRFITKNKVNKTKRE